ncbi:FHA domain-containing protein [Pseudomonas sp. p21]|uniref:FHA domain-containing protein n=1 Tax=Pseudomonas sp. p21 TaxID=1825979 RepID=UPI0007C7AF4F|nr:FHA domain-containing protein [Pseudomonas sp. p21]
MSTNVLSPGITLSVLNPEKLLHGSEPRHRFDRAGGSIGSQGDWRLHDRGARIFPVHCEIGWHEGHFCIIDHSGKSFMNGNDTELLSGTPIRLRHNDRLQMGDYQIAIHLLSEDEKEPEQHASRNPLSELRVTPQMCPLQVLGAPTTDLSGPLRPAAPGPVDELDPLAYLDRAAQARVDPAIVEIFGKEVQ